MLNRQNASQEVVTEHIYKDSELEFTIEECLSVADYTNPHLTSVVDNVRGNYKTFTLFDAALDDPDFEF